MSNATFDCAFLGGADACTACAPGNACAAAGTVQPAPCPRGFFCADGVAAVACAPGAYAPTWNATNCTACPAVRPTTRAAPCRAHTLSLVRASCAR